ncbi:MAG TPA: long-chain fatty acid--CoA ligase [Solirubrobacteraceae bacterium]|nr:long-chain fatty acid--CoA ligase [Solirubrobacteraceae bacterium]
MLEGLMQHDHPLTLQHVLERMRGMNGDGEVVTLTGEDKAHATYAEVGERVDRLCRGLTELGIGEGDRVATFAWNTQHHLEAYLAAPCMGAVLHTLNIRLFPEQLVYVVNHAQDSVILVDGSLVEPLAELAPKFESVRHFVVMGDADLSLLPDAISYEELIERQPPGFDYPVLDDRAAAGLCYTSGTTGNPKGVLYSHRSNILHAMAQCLADALGTSRADRVLPVVPMFHANAWGLPYAACMAGADLIMPGRFLQAEPLARLIEEERVTVAGAVPTIWMDLLRYADEHKPDLSSLRIVACGGSAVPRALMEAFEERHAMKIIQAWGMTETSPLGSVAHPPPEAEGEDHWGYRSTAGRLIPLVEARIVADDGEILPWDGEATGELQVRGPWIARTYYEDPEAAEKFDDGWLRTGDVAAIDPRGYIRISDRSKDVIKSGGEWISSVDLEVELMAHPDVAEAAVIAKPDERWSERPLACVVTEEGASVSAEELSEHLADRVAKFWIPDEFAFIDEVPKTSVGKFDKKVLRKRLEAGELDVRESGPASRQA